MPPTDMEKAIINELLTRLDGLYDDRLFKIVSDLDDSEFTMTVSHARDDTPYSHTVDLNDPKNLDELEVWLTDIVVSWLIGEEVEVS